MKKYSKKKVFKFNKKRDAVFLIFVLGTLLFWFLINLSKSYQQVVSYPIDYISLPKEYIFQEEAPKELSLRIKASGFHLLGLSFSKSSIRIAAKNLKRKNKYDYYLTNDYLKKQVINSIKEDVTLIDVMSDTLFLKLGKRSFKKVPVIANISLNYHAGFKSFLGYKITPDSIEVSGPEMQIDEIKKIELQSFKREDVQVSIHEKLKVKLPQSDKVQLSESIVSLDVEVEKITEKTLIVPIKIINRTNQGEIVIYPKKIAVTGLVRLSEFNEIKSSDFVIVCDYQKRTDKYMTIELQEQPSNISKVKLSVDEVEYLILK